MEGPWYDTATRIKMPICRYISYTFLFTPPKCNVNIDAKHMPNMKMMVWEMHLLSNMATLGIWISIKRVIDI